MSKKQDCAAIILAAGRSRRMGTPKPFLVLENGRTFLEHILSIYQAAQCVPIAVIVNEDFKKHYSSGGHVFLKDEQLVINDDLDKGRFRSVWLGAKSIQHVDKSCFIQNVDNPFVNNLILEMLSQYKSANKYVYPCIGDRGGHPILLGAHIVSYIAAYLQEDGNLRNVLKRFRHHAVRIDDGGILYNINTPEDYKSISTP